MSGKHRQDPPKSKEPTFRNSTLQDQLAHWKKAEAKPEKPAPPPRVVHHPPPPKPVRHQPGADEQEDAFFRSAMEEVQPLRRTHADREPPRVERVPPEVNEDAEAFAALAELVATGEGLDLMDTDEYFEGIAKGVDHNLLRKLRRGDFSVQAHLDLHGLLSENAHQELDRFLTDSRRRGHRCVLVIHGRGLHSKDQEPVLKARMGPWLSRGKLSRIVLAFATARPADGGAGALYVLLRR